MAGFGGSVKLTGESEYQKALKSITQNLTVLSSEMKVVNSLYDKNDASTAKLSQQNDVLGRKLDEQNKKLAEAKKMLDQAKNSTDSNAETVAKWQNEVNKAQAEVNKTTREIRENTETIKKNENALDDANDELEEFDKNQKNAGQSAIKMGDLIKANVISDVIVGGIKALGSAMAEVAGKFMDFVKGGVQNASDLQEVQNVVDTVFGESSEAVNEFAKNAGVQFGMTELNAKKFAGTMGAMLDSMGVSEDATKDMSLSLVGLAGDMASFYNLEHDEVWQKIRAGISGETEPLKQLGINMSVANLEAYALSQGIETAYKEMTQAEQATLRYNYLMQATANAQGDFAKTSDSYANQQKIMSLQFENMATNIGTFLLPTLNEAMIAFNGMLSGEISMEQGVQRLTQIVVDLANAIIEKLPTLLSSGITMLETIIQGFMSALPNLLPAITNLTTQLLGFIVNALPLIIDAGVGILLALVQGIVASIPTLVPAVVQAVMTIVENLIGNIDQIIDAGIQLLTGLMDGLILAIPVLLEAVPVIIEKLLTAIINNLPKIIKSGFELLGKFQQGIYDAIPQLIQSIPKIIVSIVSALIQGIPQLIRAGGELLAGLFKGLLNPQAIWNAVKGLFDGIVGGIKELFGIHSPSKVFEDEIGKNLALGLGVGFEDAMAGVKDQMSNAIPTQFDIDANATGGAGQQASRLGEMVEAFKQALKEVSVVLDDEVAGRFVTDTVEKVIYT